MRSKVRSDLQKWTKPAVVLAAVVVLLLLFREKSITVANGEITLVYEHEVSGDATSGRDLPMLIALHGNGDTPGHFHDTALDLITSPAHVLLFEAPISYGSGSAWPGDRQEIDRYSKALVEAVDQLSLQYPTRGKPVLLGFSGGAVMAWHIALTHGDQFSAVIPVSGRFEKAWVSQFTTPENTAIHVFHGKQDRVLAVGGSRLAVRSARDLGMTVSYIEFDGGHLGLFTNMKPQITELMDQLLQSTSR